MGRVAVVMGIDDYAMAVPLSGCENDARELAKRLEAHDNGDPNFVVKLHLASDAPLTRLRMRQAIRALFEEKGLDVAMFYFAGHGILTRLGGYLVSEDGVTDDEGIGMTELIGWANASDARERIIVLDCCHAGAIDQALSAQLPLTEGVSILAAARAEQSARETNQRGLFSAHLCDALDGGAADVPGDVTIASTYAYIDQMFKPLEQRPLFKANISKLVSIRRAKPAIPLATLRKLTVHFENENDLYPLSPSYEPTEEPRHPEHEAIFAQLQSYQSARLLVPVGAEFMYYAAKNSKACQLTAEGRYYWRRVKAGRL